MTVQEAADTLELYITTSDKRTLDAFDFAFKHATRHVQRAASVLAQNRREWHDDPEGDPEGYAEYHAPTDQQFPPEAIALVVMELFNRCERVRQENILNELEN